MTEIKENRTYYDRDPKTREKILTKLQYTVQVQDGVVVDVINQSGDTVMRNSEVFEFYSKKHNGK